MSLLLDALRRSRSGEDRPDKSGRTAHADQVLATLGYSPQAHRPWPRRIAIIVIGGAVLVALAWWGLPFLTGSPPEQTAQTRQAVQPRPAPTGKSVPQQPRRVPELAGQTPARTPAPPAATASNATTQRPTSAAETGAAPIPQRSPAPPPRAAVPPLSGSSPQTTPQVPARGVAPPKSGTVTLAPEQADTRGTVTRSQQQPRQSVTVPLSARVSTPAAPSVRTTSSIRRPPIAPTAPPAVEPSRPDDFRLALYYQRSGDFERALTHYRAVLERNELNAEAHNNLGLLYQQKGLAPDAIREFQRAIAINPRYTRAHNNLGVAWMRQGKLDLAQAEFQAVLSIDSGDTDALVNLALSQKGARQPEAAKTTLLRALSIDPSDAAAHYNLALLYDESGETARAVEHYRDFLEHVGVEHADLAPEVRARVDQLISRLH